jgi:hypothetical protein
MNSLNASRGASCAALLFLALAPTNHAGAQTSAAYASPVAEAAAAAAAAVGKDAPDFTLPSAGREGAAQVTYRNMKFNALREDAYKELGVAIAAAKAR